jgi:hypothetical protein
MIGMKACLCCMCLVGCSSLTNDVVESTMLNEVCII